MSSYQPEPSRLVCDRCYQGFDGPRRCERCKGTMRAQCEFCDTPASAVSMVDGEPACFLCAGSAEEVRAA